ncbi:hypothetical protein BMS3Bbin11_00108 [bacterium BMS3Bbin11]|nr:hypothetical protein BMS3Abin11_01844 [bacterium BMS3Abin11]GBE45029.1 hypothetical protein BMS3Bbin11_00108 [bacterium BMS3Bbin11]HDZ78957.1 hypothetical protein [Gammaproteobacteria bacterium]
MQREFIAFSIPQQSFSLLHGNLSDDQYLREYDKVIEIVYRGIGDFWFLKRALLELEEEAEKLKNKVFPIYHREHNIWNP